MSGYKCSDLSDAIRRLIKRKEIDLDLRCGLIWEATNPRGETYLFGRFNSGQGDHIIVTLGYHSQKELTPGMNVHAFKPSY